MTKPQVIKYSPIGHEAMVKVLDQWPEHTIWNITYEYYIPPPYTIRESYVMENPNTLERATYRLVIEANTTLTFDPVVRLAHVNRRKGETDEAFYKRANDVLNILLIIAETAKANGLTHINDSTVRGDL